MSHLKIDFRRQIQTLQILYYVFITTFYRFILNMSVNAFKYTGMYSI